MKVIFCRSWLPGSVLIRMLTFSKWSHVAVVTNGGVVIEAVWPRVRINTLEKLRSTHRVCEEREIDIPAESVNWLYLQVGKPYDISALFAVLIPWRKWDEDDKWFCSELVARAMGLFEESNRVSPQTLYLLSKPAVSRS
jgi:uncharacterized protein YycO